MIGERSVGGNDPTSETASNVVPASASNAGGNSSAGVEDALSLRSLPLHAHGTRSGASDVFTVGGGNGKEHLQYPSSSAVSVLPPR